jgi:uncharacterized membrane protein (GlpM family)
VEGKLYIKEVVYLKELFKFRLKNPVVMRDALSMMKIPLDEGIIEVSPTKMMIAEYIVTKEETCQ